MDTELIPKQSNSFLSKLWGSLQNDRLFYCLALLLPDTPARTFATLIEISSRFCYTLCGVRHKCQCLPKPRRAQRCKSYPRNLHAYEYTVSEIRIPKIQNRTAAIKKKHPFFGVLLAQREGFVRSSKAATEQRLIAARRNRVTLFR